jgi:hypothetical protein
MTTPNIILINCDDLGYGDLGSYGSTANKTPALDRMAREGTRFTDFYMASPVCSPSRGAMMTGCYPPRLSFGDFVDGAVVLFPGDGIGLNTDEITESVSGTAEISLSSFLRLMDSIAISVFRLATITVARPEIPIPTR